MKVVMVLMLVIISIVSYSMVRLLPGDPIRFMISTTLADQSPSRRANVLGAGESIGVC
jgi:ABC-type dipeptide/oligopeptide/nickel transport system permease component